MMRWPEMGRPLPIHCAAPAAWYRKFVKRTVVLMNVNRHLFRVELNEQILILSPTSNLSELEFTELEEATQQVLQELDRLDSRKLIFDFAGTDYYGSTALGFFIKLWKRLQSLHGQMVFCNVSAHERDVLKLTHLDNLWTICSTRDEAFQHLQSE